MTKKNDEKRREEAFRTYLRLGSLNATAKELGMSTPQLVRWAKEGNWEERSRLLKKQLTFHFNALKLAQESELTRLQLVELQFLEYLQTIISEKIISGAIQPKTWKDILDTQKFVLSEMRLLLGMPTSIAKVESKSTPAQNPPDEQIDKDTLRKLIEEAHEVLSDDE